MLRFQMAKRVGVVMVVCAAVVAAPSPVDAAPVSSGCTIVGTSGNDDLVGTPGNDVICGGDGDDRIDGGGGDDFLDGENGNDWLEGNAGDDLIFGGDGADYLDGGIGGCCDVEPNTGRDSLFGGPGDDILWSADFGSAVLNGDAGNDTLFGLFGPDEITAGPGADHVFAGGADDVIYTGFDSEIDIVDAEEGTNDFCDYDLVDVVTNCEGLGQIALFQAIAAAAQNVIGRTDDRVTEIKINIEELEAEHEAYEQLIQMSRDRIEQARDTLRHFLEILAQMSQNFSDHF